MDADIYEPMLPYRFIAGWRATLRNYPPRGTKVLNSRLGQSLMTPPAVADIEIESPRGYPLRAHLQAWELVEKPGIRPYYRAELVIYHGDDDEAQIEEMLLVDPYEANLEAAVLRLKIERFIIAALHRARDRATREL